MTAQKAVGRPPKVNYKIINKLVDAIQHNTSITDSCRYAKISRSTYYHYMSSNEIFAEKMAAAKENQNKLVMSFQTLY